MKRKKKQLLLFYSETSSYDLIVFVAWMIVVEVGEEKLLSHFLFGFSNSDLLH